MPRRYFNSVGASNVVEPKLPCCSIPSDYELEHRAYPLLGPPLHIDNLASLLKPWSNHTFSVRDLVGLPRPLSLSSLPIKANYSPDQVSPLPPSDNEVFLFSDGSKARKRVGAAFIHFHPPATCSDPTSRSHLQTNPPDSTTTPPPYPPNSITRSHLLSLPWHMSVFNTELYAASCALQYAAPLSPPPRSRQLKCRQPSNHILHLTPRILLSSSSPPRHLQSHIHPAHLGFSSSNRVDTQSYRHQGQPPRWPHISMALLPPALSNS